MESFGLTGKNLAAPAADLGMLSREIIEHREEDKNRSYLSQLIVGATQMFHGEDKSLLKLEALQLQYGFAKTTGDLKGAQEAHQEIREAVKGDLAARQSAQSWSDHAGGFAKSVGLFMPGRSGYALSAVLNASDAAHSGDSLERQLADAGLGAGKGVALKWTFNKVGASEMNLMLKAGTLSIGNRLADTGLNSRTYFDSNGNFDLEGGLWRTAVKTADPTQLATDAITFGAGYLALRKLGLNAEFAKANPLSAQAITGGAFGFSSGFFNSVQAQQKLGLPVDYAYALKGGLVQMTLDGGAAAFGASFSRAPQSAVNSRELAENSAKAAGSELKAPKLELADLSKHVELVLGFDGRPVARPKVLASSGDSSVSIAKNDSTIGGGDAASSVRVVGDRSSISVVTSPGIREFVVAQNVSDLIPRLSEQGASARALVNVREVLNGDRANPQLGPEKSMLIQHIEQGLRAPVEGLRSADLLATCNPRVLEALGIKDVTSRHLFPDATGDVLLQVPGSNRLRFSLPEALKASEHAGEPALKLGAEARDLKRNSDRRSDFSEDAGRHPERGMTVSQWLRSLDPKDRMSDLHDVKLMAKALERFDRPIERYLGGGNETIAFVMKDGGVLRLTDKPFRQDWGTRTLEVDGRPVRFDASIIGKRTEIMTPDGPVSYYYQQRGITPVKLDDVHLFDHLIERNGKYVFWDNDQSSWGRGQLAYVPLLKLPDGSFSAIPLRSRAGMSNRGLALIDYDAVRIKGTEPKQSGDSGKSWFDFRQYDFEPFDR